MNTDSAIRAHSAGTDAMSSERAAAWAVDALVARRGMLRIGAVGGAAEIFDGISSRLPSTHRWCVVEAPRTPAAVWSALFEGDLQTGEEPGPRLREILWQRARAGVGTVLGITETALVPDEVLAVLEELAGLEPMLQIVFATEVASGRDSEAAARLAMRVRASVRVEYPEPLRAPAAATPVEAVPRRADPTRAEQAVVPESVAEALAPVRVAPVAVPTLEAASQRTFDPFRGHFVRPALDSPQLLPVLSDPHGLHAEWFRVLRLRLEDWIKARGETAKAIAVSGPEAGVGKTFVSANLALLWANSTFERVLLVDGDLRRPQFHQLFEIPQRPGLADVLARRFAPEQCITFVKEVGLHVMPAGRAGNPRQLVNPDRVERVLEALKESYDLILVDCPPLVGMVDARSFAAACDGTLMVVRSGQTRMRLLQKATEELPPERIIGAVVNGAETGTESAYTQYRKAVHG